MRLVPLIVAALFSVGSVSADGIREFDIPTLERLGIELSRRDEIAARACDLIEERYPESKPSWRGWITDLGEDADRVYLTFGSASEVTQGYTVVFPHSGHPEIEDHRSEALPPQIAIRYKARQTALTALEGKLFDVSYNMEVLNDPDGSGFLVYALASTNEKGEILTGGHYRVTVSADAGLAEKIDLLSQLIRQPKADRGHGVVAVGSSQLASNIPVETWLYSSYVYHLPMYVATKDGSTWRIVNGKIHKFTKTEIDDMKSKPKKKKK